MSYVVMARKWRPALFGDVIAQSHVTVTLQNAVRTGRIAHAYLFAGPRGSGKTTTARILAKALNCDQGPTPTPCNACRACESIIRGTSPDVLEIDAASNRGIDEIRSLREKVIIGVSKQSGYKVYIIDEVHMLTPEAFNALLKTLEEPPPHVIFILATTEHHKVPATILSRCQRFNFRRIPSEDIVRQLIHIAGQEGIEVSEEALFLIARRADGAMRDAQSLLDQVVTFAGTSVTPQAVQEALGILDQGAFFRLTEAILTKDRAAGLTLIDEVMSEGGDAGEFSGGLLEHLRNLLICKVHGGSQSLDLSDADRLRYQTCAERFTEPDLQRMIQVVSDLDRDIGGVAQPRLHLELAVLRMIAMEQTVAVEDLLARLDRLEERLKGGLPARPSPAPSPRSIPESAPVSPGQPSNYDRQKPVEPVRGRRMEEDAPVQEGRRVTDRDPSPQHADRPEGIVPDASKVPSGSEPARASAPSDTGIRTQDSGRSSPEPDPPASGPVSLEQVQARWEAVVSRAKTDSISLGAHLDAGTPVALSGQTLQIGFPSRASFSASHIRRKKKALEEIIAAVIGTRLLVDCRTEGADQEGLASQEADAGQKDREEVSSSVQTVLQIFDGEIIRR